MMDLLRTRLVFWLLTRRSLVYTRPGVFRFVAHVLGILSSAVARHDYDDVDATEQRAISNLGRAIANARDVAIETAEFFEALEAPR